jgi:hypothetical protein
MNIFELKCCRYDDFEYYLFSHEDKTNNQFEIDVSVLMRKYGKEYIEQETRWVELHSWIEYIIDKMEELGYKKIIPISVSFGDPGLFGESTYEWESDTEFRKYIGEELYELASFKNRKLNERINKSMEDQRERTKEVN